jgi:hypothetical protein
MKFFTLALVLLLVTFSSADSSRCTGDDQAEWFGKALREIDGVREGMTRADLVKVFKPEGGFSSASRLKGTFVYRGSPYVKTGVGFSPSSSDESGPQSPNDVITSISRPYLGYPVYD